MSWHLTWSVLFQCLLSFCVSTRHLLGFPTKAFVLLQLGKTPLATLSVGLSSQSVAEASPWALCCQFRACVVFSRLQRASPWLSGLLEMGQLRQSQGL